MATSSTPSGYFLMTVVGNLGADPEMRYTQQGTAVTNFRLAVNQRIPAGGGEWEVAAQWFKVTVWGKQAEACNAFLHSGSKVLVEAERFNFDRATGAPELFQRSDGTNGANYEITARMVRFLDRAPGGQAEPAPEEEIVFE